METLTELKPGDKVISELSDVVLIFKEYSDKHVILEVEKTGIIVNYPPTAKLMGWASRVSTSTIVDSSP